MFELYYRDGGTKERLFRSRELEELARLTAEKAGEDPEKLLDLGVFDDE